jgi:DNA topoisomerase-6 subunit B
MPARPLAPETAESMARKQREISVSEFFLKNRHLLGFDSPRKALLTAVKEAVDNSLDACEEAGILPEINVEIVETDERRFRVSVTDNGPGIVKAQIPRIFAKLLYGSKFHRLRMARGQQGIGISAACLYSQLTTGKAARIRSKVRGRKAHALEVHLDTRGNKPSVLRDEVIDWDPVFPAPDGARKARRFTHGTRVGLEMEAAYVRGRQSVDEFLRQCAVVNPHLQMTYRVVLRKDQPGPDAAEQPTPDVPWTAFRRSVNGLPAPPREIKPHPHGVELGVLIQMLKDTRARTLRSALQQDFSRISSRAAEEICGRAGLDPRARPTRIAHRESEALYRALGETKLMRPATDCLSPIGEEELEAGLRKGIRADFYTAVTRPPAVYRGNPFQVEAGLAYGRSGEDTGLSAEDPVRVLRFANRVPLLHMAGACAVTRAVGSVNWRNYGLTQPRHALPVGPAVILLHMASVWVPFTSESKEAVAHYPEIIREFTFALQECGRRLGTYLLRRKRAAETERKRTYIEQYIPHLALGLKEILNLNEREEGRLVERLTGMLEHSRLDL